MPRLPASVVLILAALAFAGCCRDTIREMASLKDVREPPHHRRAVEKADDGDRERAKAVEKDDDDDDKIETGSVDGAANCQGAHIAYQATKEYLKNFGPKPPDQPGDKGACKPQ
jgi:hypothetical protein